MSLQLVSHRFLACRMTSSLMNSLHKHCDDQGQALACISWPCHSNYLVVQYTFSSGYSPVSIDLCTFILYPLTLFQPYAFFPDILVFSLSNLLLPGLSELSIYCYCTTAPDPPIFTLLCDIQAGFCKYFSFASRHNDKICQCGALLG